MHPGLVALLERLGHDGGLGCRVVDGGVAVRVRKRFGDFFAGKAVDLDHDALGGLEVELFERVLTENLVASEKLEQVELNVAQVALVMAHRILQCVIWPRITALLASNLSIRVEFAIGKPHCSM